MVRFIQILKVMLLCAGMLACLSIAWLAYSVRRPAVALLADTRRVALSIGGVSAELRDEVKAWKKEAGAQAAASTEAARRTVEVLRKADTAIDRLTTLEEHLTTAVDGLNEQVRTVGPAISGAAVATAGSVVKVADASARSIDQVAKDLQPVARKGVETLEATRAAVADPAIPAALGSIAGAAKSLEATSANTVAISTDLKDAVHRATRPASFAARIGGKVIDLAVKAGSILAGFFK